MKSQVLVLATLAGLFVPMAQAAAPVGTAGKTDWLTKHPTIQKLVDLTNQHRAQSGLGPVTVNGEMCLAAHRHAEWMASAGALQHSGLPYRENIFLGPATPDAAVQGWINSPAHRANLLSGSQVGFGYVNRNGQLAWVAVFQ
ncbi:MAG TPA: CAP domain-containing protein [Planctomycetaceae bacterium]|nr:CAP domain-containing protein [Planctomycetaceae bacterium]